MKMYSRGNKENSINNYSAKGIVNGLRKRVLDSTIPPYNSIVNVQAPLSAGNLKAASGCVVGKNKVLTSAHVAENSVIGGLITPGLNEQAPYGSFHISSIDIPQEWIINGIHDSSYDYAIITVEPNSAGIELGDIVPPLQIKRTNIQDLVVGELINLIGYPGDKGSSEMWECQGEVLRDDGKYYCLNDLFGWPPRFITISSDAVSGNSGGPILNKYNEIIGVFNLLSSNVPGFCDGETGGNGAPMMDDIALNWLLGRMQ